jgi:threonine dehydratase
MTMTHLDILKAAKILNGHAHKTPVLTSTHADALTKAKIFFKCENLQRIGAFKFRGAFFAISKMSAEQRIKGVVAFSAGNHAQAIALSAREQKIPVVIVMPSDAPASKLAATRGYGAEVITYNRETEDREAITNEIAKNRGMTLIPPYNHADVMAGQGTAALELIEEVGELDYLFVCIGGGGMIAGCSLITKHLLPKCKVIGVEPEAGNDAQQSLRSGSIVKIATPKTIADGAQTQSIGPLCFPIIQKYVDDILTVTDEELCSQMLFFMERMKMVVEPTGCLSGAGAMTKKMDLRGKKVGVIVSGGNVDPEKFSACLSRGKQIIF